MSIRILLSALALLLLTTPTHAADPVTTPRLYTLDCGKLAFKDFGMFSDTGEYDGQPAELTDPCFLIRHAKGNFLWDSGLGDSLAGKPGVADANGITQTVTVTLADQLKTLGLTPADVTQIAFSHFHFDHTGNANLFPAATWILNKNELNWAHSTPTPFGINPDSFSAYKTAKTEMIDGDYDVFGDGTVRILKTPGHTPGSQVLMLKLSKTGPVILSGDLYHAKASRDNHRVPGFNHKRADTLASIDRVEKIVANTKARFIIQHAPEDFAALPKFPEYLE